MTRQDYIRQRLDELLREWGIRAAILGVVIFLLLAGLDYLTSPEHFARFLFLRIPIAALLAVFAWILHTTRNPMLHRVLVCMAVLAAAAAIEMMLMELGGHASPNYPGMIMLGVAVIGFIPLRFLFHLIMAGAILLIYAVPILIFDRITDIRSFVMSSTFMTLIFAIVLVQRFLTNKHLTTHFEQQYEIEEYKRDLEEQVNSRTSELDDIVAKLELEIEEHKQAELRVQRSAAELKERNEELNWFAYSIAHDLRAPLVNIKGFTAELTASIRESLASISVPGPLPEDEDRIRAMNTLVKDIPASAAFVSSSVDRMNGLLNAMLKLFRLINRDLKPDTVDLAEVVQTVLHSLDHHSEGRMVKIETGPLPSLVADRVSLAEILRNLLDNAVKYRDPSRSGVVSVWAEQDGRETLIFVRDNGRGITAEDIPKVFEAFRRVGS